ncbi:MAG: FG-GAP-like repeat-containing protein, partial [Pseudomonadota bacterium]|nr:FG-GAP-like repeat-containing protein [Pseudomonadota bacterium]
EEVEEETEEETDTTTTTTTTTDDTDEDTDNGGGGGGGTSTAAVTPSMSIADVTTSDESAANATFTVTLSESTTNTITVDYASSNSTASAGSDYTATSGTLTISAGSTTGTFTVPVLSDATDENNETATLTLSSASNATISDATATLTITDDDDAPTISINDVTASDESAANSTFTATLSAASAKTITVDYASSNDSLSFTAADIATSADGARDVHVADMDGDGDLDIVSASSIDDTIAWYENDGAADPSFTAANIATSADGAWHVHVADMDGDGDLDIVSASQADDTIAWYENDGASDPTWSAADIATSADYAASVYVADMDGDGDLDIVSASDVDDTIAWYQNDGASDPSWTAADIATSADGAYDVHVVDLDGDGDLDIVSASGNDDTIAWYENDGAADPSWSAADIATSADDVRGVHVADMDGDGDLDIVSASILDDTIAWYESNAADKNLDADAVAGVDYTAASGTLTFDA